MEYKFFMTPMCPDCGEIKEFLSTLEMKGEIVDATTDEGMDLARKYDISSVPVMLFFDGERKIAEAEEIDEIKTVIENKNLNSF